MKTFILGLSLLVSSASFAEFGPMPFERYDLEGKKANSSSGRYIYLGDVPKFEATELEITISKMALTTRVTGYVTQARIDGYATQLYHRWKTVDEDLKSTSLRIHPLIPLKATLDPVKYKTARLNHEAWVKVADQYTKHSLEKSGLDVYAQKRSFKNFSDSKEEINYKEKISKAYFKSLFGPDADPARIESDSAALDSLLSPANSHKLFLKNLGHLYTPKSSRTGFVGELNFVYPIAASVDGPFKTESAENGRFVLPPESVMNMRTAESFEARAWSNRWEDEFGGFPFLLIDYSQVAFHGPITAFWPLDVWYLQRGYVSHGCHRMDASDVLELRALMPADLKKVANKIRINMLSYFDVTDIDKDGKVVAVDVKYYNIPSSILLGKKTIDEAIKPWLVENQERTFFKTNKYAAKFYDSPSDTLRNIPKYVIGPKSLKREGVHSQVPIRRFDHRGNRIIQYEEVGCSIKGMDDRSCEFPPLKYQQN